MSPITHALLATVWCFYGILTLTHSTAFWAALLGIDMPNFSILVVDAAYYTISVVLVPYYLRKSWRHIRICLVRN